MDIDRATIELVAQIIGQNLHIARQYQKVRLQILHQLPQLGFLLGFGVSSDGQIVKWQLIPLGQIAHHVVIGNHSDNINRQGAIFPAI